MPEIKETKINQDRPYEPTPEEEKLLTKWKARFKRAKEFREPYQAKWLQMYQLYRAYQHKQNYAYNTRLMPPIAFEIVKTVVSRLATAKRKTQIIPRHKDDVESPSLGSWGNLVNYDFDIIDLVKKLPNWIESSVLYGNGIVKLAWKVMSRKGKVVYDDPTMGLVDLWELLPAPETVDDLQDGCPWLIQRIVKNKEKIEKEEEARGEDKIYKNLEFCEPKIVEDWKKERYEINGKKMSQVDGELKKDSDGEKVLPAKEDKEKQLELWECWDYEEDKLIVICNGEVVIRDDENPYLDVNNGHIYVDLPDMPLLWEFWTTGHIEPVETTIHEIADLRNQRMDDVILMLDPVVKIRKDSGITKNDIIFSPGATWELRKMDDVVIERPPEISLMGVNEDKLMRDEISRTLALGEYMSGQPQSPDEPLGKVTVLLGQSNLRLSMNAQNIAVALTKVANILIQLNQEFINENKLYRLIGKDVDFKEFKREDKKVVVDAIIEVEPIIPPDKNTRLNQVLLMYDKFIAQDKPDANNPEEVQRWLKRKRELQKMILEELDKEEYIELLLGPDAEAKELPQNNATQPPVAPAEAEMPPQPPLGKVQQLMSRIPILGKMLGG
jgi:hypothetical protein